MQTANEPMSSKQDVESSNDKKIGQDMPNVGGKVPDKDDLSRDKTSDQRAVSSAEKSENKADDQPAQMPTEGKAVGGTRGGTNDTTGNP